MYRETENQTDRQTVGQTDGRIDSMDCLPMLLSMSVFYLLVVLFSIFVFVSVQ